VTFHLLKELGGANRPINQSGDFYLKKKHT